jgi:cytochrome c oxidase subunit 3
MKKNNQKHPFHLVDPSPWPFLAAISALSLTFGFVMYMHSYAKGSFLYKAGVLLLLVVSFFWWRDIVREATFEGQHTLAVQKGLKLGVLLFIVSEVMFFFGFFWAFFHFSFNPSIFIGGVWPPAFLNTLDPWKIPLLNTILLITSGATITLAHHSITLGSKDLTTNGLIATVTGALVFTFLQVLEYYNAPFSISTSVYGSSFFMLTGFHGFHVIIGTTFLIVCLIRLYFNHFTKEHHLGFEAAIWYWHFVDAVWLLLYITVYLWGS